MRSAIQIAIRPMAGQTAEVGIRCGRGAAPAESGGTLPRWPHWHPSGVRRSCASASVYKDLVIVEPIRQSQGPPCPPSIPGEGQSSMRRLYSVSRVTSRAFRQACVATLLRGPDDVAHIATLVQHIPRQHSRRLIKRLCVAQPSHNQKVEGPVRHNIRRPTAGPDGAGRSIVPTAPRPAVDPPE